MSSHVGNHQEPNGNAAPSRPRRAKKPISANRRMQNRVAQKAYRDRRRERIKELENKLASLETATPTNPAPSASDPIDLVDLDILPEQTTTYTSVNDSSVESSWNEVSAWLDPSLIDFNYQEDADLREDEPLTGTSLVIPSDLSSLPEIRLKSSTGVQMASETAPDPKPLPGTRQRLTTAESDFGSGDSQPTASKAITIYRPSGKIVSARPCLVKDYYLSLSHNSQSHLRRLAKDGDYTFVDMISSVLESTASDTEDSETSSSIVQSLLEPTSYSPYRNVLRIARLSYFAAFFANFSSLGFDFSAFLDENSVSPLCGQKSVDVGGHDIPLHLRPVESQFTVAHHPYIDSLPFPTFRRRALAALVADPPLLDEDDLCIDLMLNDGLVCWGSVANHTDHGTPWDSHSWEAKEWFLHKWWWLVGGQDGELWHSSRWWASQRGERISMKLPVGG